MYKLLAILVIPFLLMGCIKINTLPSLTGSGNMKTETRDVSDYQRVEISGIGDAELIQGDKEGVEITADDNLLPYIETVVHNGTLRIGFKPGLNNLKAIRSVEYKIYVKQIEGVELSGAVNSSSTSITSDKLDLNLSGAGSFIVSNLALKSLKVDLSGATKVELTGEAESQDIEVSGAGSYKAGDLTSKVVHVDMSGASAITVYAVDELTVNASGAGVVSYYGKPTVRQDLSGVAVLKALGEK